MMATAEQSSAATLARTTARVLVAGTWLAAFAAAISLAALVAVATGSTPALGWLAAVALGAVAIYYALRARFDGRLFDGIANMLAAGATEAAALETLDSALELRFGAAPRPDRPLADRARGAVRLLRRAFIVAVLQLVLVALLWLYGPR